MTKKKANSSADQRFQQYLDAQPWVHPPRLGSKPQGAQSPSPPKASDWTCAALVDWVRGVD